MQKKSNLSTVFLKFVEKRPVGGCLTDTVGENGNFRYFLAEMEKLSTVKRSYPQLPAQNGLWAANGSVANPSNVE